MDFDQLITFLEVVKLGNFSRAGQKVHKSDKLKKSTESGCWTGRVKACG